MGPWQEIDSFLEVFPQFTADKILALRKLVPDDVVTTRLQKAA